MPKIIIEKDIPDKFAIPDAYADNHNTNTDTTNYIQVILAIIESEVQNTG